MPNSSLPVSSADMTGHAASLLIMVFVICRS